MPVTSWTPQGIYSAVEKAHLAAAAKATAAAKLAAPSRTGTLRRSIMFKPTGLLSGEIGSELKYAAAQNEGAGPHDIGEEGQILLLTGALSAGAVTKSLSQSGELFRRAPVHHPGNPGTHYLDAVKPVYGSTLAMSLMRV